MIVYSLAESTERQPWFLEQRVLRMFKVIESWVYIYKNEKHWKGKTQISSPDSNFKHAQIWPLDYIMKGLCETCFFIMKATLRMFSNHLLLLVPSLLGKSFGC